MLWPSRLHFQTTKSLNQLQPYKSSNSAEIGLQVVYLSSWPCTSAACWSFMIQTTLSDVYRFETTILIHSISNIGYIQQCVYSQSKCVGLNVTFVRLYTDVLMHIPLINNKNSRELPEKVVSLSPWKWCWFCNLKRFVAFWRKGSCPGCKELFKKSLVQRHVFFCPVSSSWESCFEMRSCLTWCWHYKIIVCTIMLITHSKSPC